MVKQKSDILSVKHKTEGNKLFVNEEYYTALEEYNKALCFAQSKENLAFAYANRSAVYFKLKKYDECLLNIQWARENNYPQEKIQKLNEREENCLQLKVAQIKDPVDELHDFFKLSYPAHPKVPFIADCLSLGEKKGHNEKRGIFTSRDLKPGDIINVEKYVFKNVHENFAHTRCCKCIKPNMLNLIPCSKSASLMFCSEKCRQEVYEKVKNLDSMFTSKGIAVNVERILYETEEAFGGRKKLKKFIKRTDYENLNYTVFDFDFNNPDDPHHKANLIKCILSIKILSGQIALDYATSNLEPYVRAAAGNDRSLAKFLMFLSLVVESNAYSTNFGWKYSSEFMKKDILKDDEEDEQVLNANAFVTHINHRCEPSAYNIPTEDGWLLYVIKPIKAGSEVYRSYFFGPHDGKCNVYPHNIISEGTGLTCKCSTCLYGTPEIPQTPICSVTQDLMRLNTAYALTKIITDFTPGFLDSYAEIIERVKSNWACLAEYYSKFEAKPDFHLLAYQNVTIVTILGILKIFPCVTCKRLSQPFN